MRAAAAALGLVGGAAAFRSYPLFKQCDPAWGNDEMGTTGNGERSNICGEGCAMSSTSMALNGLGITIDGISANPQSLNAWLERTPGGYLCAGGDCNNLNLTIISNVPGAVTAPHLELIGELPKPSVADIQAGLTAGDTVYIAHGACSDIRSGASAASASLHQPLLGIYLAPTFPSPSPTLQCTITATSCC